jgi:LysM repeat protein
VTESTTYTIKSGDTLYGIAHEHGLGLDTLIAANKETLGPSEAIQIGQVLRVPKAEDAPAAKPAGPAQVAGATGSSAGVSGVVSNALTVSALGGVTETQLVSDTLADGSPATTDGVERVAAPILLGPGDGITVTEESVMLSWASVGVLPNDVFYVVMLRDSRPGAAQTSAEPGAAQAEMEWIPSNATVLRMPGRLRPALGSSRAIEWSVTVRRRTGDLSNKDEGALLSPPPDWHRFVWSPKATGARATP